ncbi:nuclear transport factor 2 family protein [Dictyobacter kobayashii]|uniref:SnoaL-like domain-containing protein n=1 Tax=Dictyobacter kobayashii TaxID=2014872 RepID=A0A402AS75_9CHLR|nr:nuclear transport factor 2 family protein [Dictyobacter kobayashii]GCE21955.1 hypothetical protein KDK_57550 [Dictyobacter kobayashii]
MQNVTVSEHTNIPGWIRNFYADLDDLKFGNGFDIFLPEAQMIFGTARIQGIAAIKDFFRTIDSPLNTKHVVEHFWDEGSTKLIQGKAILAPETDPDNATTIPFFHVFSLANGQMEKVAHLFIVAGPVDPEKSIPKINQEGR